VSVTTSTIQAAASFQQAAPNAPYVTPTQGPDGLTFTAQPAVATLNAVLLATYTIAASGTQSINLNSFNDAFKQAVTNTKAIAFMFVGIGNLAKVKLEPDSSNPLTWFFAGTTPSVTLQCGTGGCCFMICDGIAATLSGTVANFKITNTGSATLTLNVFALVGT